MAKAVKPEKILESLKKLYEKRKGLDKQILEAEKSLVSATPIQSDSVGSKSAGRPKGKAPATRRPPAKKKAG